jgi:hypothetical protein
LEFAKWSREYPELVAFGSMNMGLYLELKGFFYQLQYLKRDFGICLN